MPNNPGNEPSPDSGSPTQPECDFHDFSGGLECRRCGKSRREWEIEQNQVPKTKPFEDRGGWRDAIPMILFCPQCHERHVDEDEFATKPHHTHACQFCGFVWRPAIVATVGVQFLPGFKNEKAVWEHKV